MECDCVFVVYIERKAIFIHSFSDFLLTTRITCDCESQSGYAYRFNVKARTQKTDESKQQIGNGLFLVEELLRYASLSKRQHTVLQVEISTPLLTFSLLLGTILLCRPKIRPNQNKVLFPASLAKKLG